jgi:hypothetical protein
MARLGYRVLDNKPRHVIVRPRPDGTLATRHGRTLYAVVDFELLQRIEDEDEQATAANLLHRRRTG